MLQIKYIADPGMHSIPSVAVHPNGKWLCGQSLDNQIVTYSADRFRVNRKKVFKGHTSSGYACQVRKHMLIDGPVPYQLTVCVPVLAALRRRQ